MAMAVLKWMTLSYTLEFFAQPVFFFFSFFLFFFLANLYLQSILFFFFFCQFCPRFTKGIYIHITIFSAQVSFVMFIYVWRQLLACIHFARNKNYGTVYSLLSMKSGAKDIIFFFFFSKMKEAPMKLT